MTAAEILAELEKLGSEQTKKTLMRHGAREPFFGVKVGDLKVLIKKLKLKKEYRLALDLFETGNSDAMYLAALVADETKMTRADLENWAKLAYWSYLNEFSVPWVASEGEHGWPLALEWIESADDQIACCGWATLSSLVSIKNDADLDLPALGKLLDRVGQTIQKSPNRVRHVMNGFVIAVGTFVAGLTEKAIETARFYGKITVDMGGTACQVPDAEEYISKMKANGRHGKKRKEARC